MGHGARRQASRTVRVTAPSRSSAAQEQHRIGARLAGMAAWLYVRAIADKYVACTSIYQRIYLGNSCGRGRFGTEAVSRHVITTQFDVPQINRMSGVFPTRSEEIILHKIINPESACKTIHQHLCVLFRDLPKKSVLAADRTHDARFSSVGRITCGNLFPERIKKSNEESIANSLVRFLSSGKSGQAS